MRKFRNDKVYKFKCSKIESYKDKGLKVRNSK